MIKIKAVPGGTAFESEAFLNASLLEDHFLCDLGIAVDQHDEVVA